MPLVTLTNPKISLQRVGSPVAFRERERIAGILKRFIVILADCMVAVHDTSSLWIMIASDGCNQILIWAADWSSMSVASSWWISIGPPDSFDFQGVQNPKTKHSRRSQLPPGRHKPFCAPIVCVPWTHLVITMSSKMFFLLELKMVEAGSSSHADGCQPSADARWSVAITDIEPDSILEPRQGPRVMAVFPHRPDGRLWTGPHSVYCLCRFVLWLDATAFGFLYCTANLKHGKYNRWQIIKSCI